MAETGELEERSRTREEHTKYGRHNAHARVRLRLVRTSDAEFGDWREAGRCRSFGWFWWHY